MFRRFRIKILAHIGPVIVNHTAAPVVEHDTGAFDVQVSTARAVGCPDFRFAVDDEPLAVVEHDNTLMKVEIPARIFYRRVFEFNQWNPGREYRLAILQGDPEAFTALAAALETVVVFHSDSLKLHVMRPQRGHSEGIFIGTG